MKGKLVAAAAAAASNGGSGNNQTDLLVCFPSRAHLALMPKPICSPSRPGELPKRHHHPHHHHHHRHSATATTKPPPMSKRRKNSSPLFKPKARNHQHVEEELDEPTSPRITCAGQIRVRPSKARSSGASSGRASTEGRSWVSVMEEIERIRNKDGSKKKKGGGGWLEAIGIKKDALQVFSNSFHGIRLFNFNMGCFGSFHGSVECTSDDDDDEEEEDIDREVSGENSNANDVFSKWFMLIEENHDDDLKEGIRHGGEEEEEEEENGGEENSVVPPPNALLLMRCRSAPAKGLIINRAERLETEETKNANKALRDDQEDQEKEREEEKKEKEKLVVMRCAPDFFKVSMDIAKETWVVGGELDLLARSRSCRR